MTTLRKLIEQSETLAEHNEQMRKAFSGMEVANQISQALEEQRRAILQTANTAAQGFYSMDQALRASLRWQADEEQMRSAMLAMKAAADMPARMIGAFDMPAGLETVAKTLALSNEEQRRLFKDLAVRPLDMGHMLSGIDAAEVQAALKSALALPAGFEVMPLGLPDEWQPPSMGALLGERGAPAVIMRPEPAAGAPVHTTIETVHAEPDWREVISLALKEGKATKQQIVALLLELNTGSQAPPALQEVEALALDYARNGHRYESLAAFGLKHGMHRATVDRYLKMYEAATGKEIRPGRGRQKRRKKS